MANTDAAEIQVVLTDGTVMRWSGLAAEEVWSGILAAESEYIDLSASQPTATKSKPLRKVTEIHGSYSSLNNEIIGDDGCEQGRALFVVTLRDLMPEQCTSRRAKFRIVVESVEEGEEQRL